MNAKDIISGSQRDGVTLALDEQGGLTCRGARSALRVWHPRIREHKPELIRLLEKRNEEAYPSAPDDPPPSEFVHAPESPPLPSSTPHTANSEPDASAHVDAYSTETAPDPVTEHPTVPVEIDETAGVGADKSLPDVERQEAPLGAECPADQASGVPTDGTMRASAEVKRNDAEADLAGDSDPQFNRPSVEPPPNSQVTAADYTSTNIKVLSDHEVWERFDWARAGHLATKYKRDAGWIRRSLEACQQAGVSPDYFTQRYLEGDKSIPMHEGADAAYRELLRQLKAVEH